MKRKLKSAKGITPVLIGVFIWLFIASIMVIQNIRQNEEANIKQVLSDVARNNAHSVEHQIETYKNTLILAVEYFSELKESDEYFEKAFNELVNTVGFYKIVISTEDGSVYETNGEGIVFSEYEWIEDIEGECSVSNVFKDANTQKNVISITIPIYASRDRVSGFVSGIVSVERLSEVFNQTFYDIDGYYQIIDENGEYVAVSNAKNMLISDGMFYERMAGLNYAEEYNYQLFINDVNRKMGGLTEYSNNEGEERYACYSPININNWIVLTVVDKDDIQADINQNISYVLIFVANMTGAFLVVSWFAEKNQKQSIKNAIEYERKFKLVSDTINKFFIEVDLSSVSVTILGDYKDKLNREKDTTSIKEDIKIGFIHPEDERLAKDIFSKISKFESVSDVKMRIQNSEKEYVWYSVSLIPLKDDRGNNINKAAGFLENVNEEVLKTNLLKEKSELDALTKIYNKGATEAKIIEILNSSTQNDSHSLLIIDLDNFKTLNDTFGHLYGDEVLKDVAKTLKGLFRSDDIVGRIGGDEFFIFIKNSNSLEKTKERANIICQSLNKIYKKDGLEVEISSSIGIASFPANAKTFTELYKNADTALYAAKNNGKNKYMIFE